MYSHRVIVLLSKRGYIQSLCPLRIEKEKLLIFWEDPWREEKEYGNSGFTKGQMSEAILTLREPPGRLMPQDRASQSMIHRPLGIVST